VLNYKEVKSILSRSFVHRYLILYSFIELRRFSEIDPSRQLEAKHFVKNASFKHESWLPVLYVNDKQELSLHLSPPLNRESDQRYEVLRLYLSSLVIGSCRPKLRTKGTREKKLELSALLFFGQE
jgi:hypothetical protein